MSANLDGDEACKHGFTGLPEDCSRCARESYQAAIAAAHEAGRREGVEAAAKWVEDQGMYIWPNDMRAALLPASRPVLDLRERRPMSVVRTQLAPGVLVNDVKHVFSPHDHVVILPAADYDAMVELLRELDERLQGEESVAYCTFDDCTEEHCMHRRVRAFLAAETKGE